MGIYVHLSILPGVSITLNGDYIPNHGYVVISDIGDNDDTALICNTNRINNIPNPNGPHSGGDWFAPDGTAVGNLGTNDIPGFHRKRRPMVVILRRRTASDPPSEGIYYCVVEDGTFTEQTVYVGLYISGGGGKHHSDCWLGQHPITCELHVLCNSIFQETSQYQVVWHLL